jgi:hypothetical protein
MGHEKKRKKKEENWNWMNFVRRRFTIHKKGREIFIRSGLYSQNSQLSLTSPIMN